MQKIMHCLWFDSQAEEAANFYVSLFKNARIVETTRYNNASSKASGQKEGSVMTVVFELDGQTYMALNGGPIFKFSPAISIIVNCDTQEEIDHLWTKLGEGGKPNQCGWIDDKFGVTWQIVPSVLPELLKDPNPARAEAVTAALMKMGKLDIEGLKQAQLAVK